ncbi:response regulator transcription factor [Vagococcus sp. BWB3-3]|uniref:Response regulator transcription factor n=1 Tax=Vagococcus allomyrinae TaxID=2794353 RepID=A0A940PC43_9ENTE|nr:LytTR family DNA-binding domain-containing protein [Vagococcus allomyrinae]MBP1042249.1 response regulator transcription factor [Vagococcus allomyrinae]
MKHIYICDDELIYREQISSLINHSIIGHQYSLMVKAKTSSTTELLAIDFDHSESVYFLDVNIIGSPINGFELGKEIRRRDPRGFIIFVTTFEELAVETFKYRLEAMDYIVKDQPDNIANRIELCLASIMEQQLPEPLEESKMLTVKFADELLLIALSEIVFIETSSRSHMVVIHTIDQTIETAGNLQELEAQLTEEFVRSHRSFLVNRAYIKSFNLKQNLLELSTGQTCLVARRMKKSLKEVLALL